MRKAERENKPVFLSVGYSTCHWCHVMEKECFEDEEVAALLNRHYVSIKVDREERPDVDDVYMKAAVLLGQQGGWPLSIIMTPERIPFFAGTYIPKYNRYHIVGMMNLLEPLAEHFRSNSKELQEVIEAMRTQSKRLVPSLVSENESAQPELVYQGLMQYFDPKNGGFGQGMKFPRSHQLWYLLTHYRQTGEADALEAVKRTLLNIRRGGIFDQLGFGVHRYSVDDEWFVPHFEKMLYNQAQLSLAALRYYEITGENWAETMGREIFTYVLRDMTSPEGGFYSAEDADSEGEEGAFYLWEHQEIEETLSPREFELFRIVFPIEQNGNWTDPSVREQRPTNILRISESGEALMSEMSQEESQTLKAACAKLLARRSHRPRPELDDKILTDWNGLMIVSMAEGGRILKEASYLDAAKRAFRFIRDKLHVEDKLFHRYRDGENGDRRPSFRSRLSCLGRAGTLSDDVRAGIPAGGGPSDGDRSSPLQILRGRIPPDAGIDRDVLSAADQSRRHGGTLGQFRRSVALLRIGPTCGKHFLRGRGGRTGIALCPFVPGPARQSGGRGDGHRSTASPLERSGVGRSGQAGEDDGVFAGDRRISRGATRPFLDQTGKTSRSRSPRWPP